MGVEMILPTLTAIILLYFFWLLLPLPKKPCAICAAVSTTWLGLLALKLSGYNIPLLIPAILMGETVVGGMYAIEKKDRRFRILRPFIILVGTATVYVVLRYIYG
jgi:hypothetical protein